MFGALSIVDHYHGTIFVVFALSCGRCISYQFLRCVVGFEQNEERTFLFGEKRKKSRPFGLTNQLWERPGYPKLSSGGPVRVPKREKGRIPAFFFSGYERASWSEKVGAAGRVRTKRAKCVIYH